MAVNHLNMSVGLKNRVMRLHALRPKSAWSLVLALSGLRHLQAFMTPHLPAVPYGTTPRARFRSPTIRRLTEICPRPELLSALYVKATSTSSLNSTGSTSTSGQGEGVGVGREVEMHGKEQEGPADVEGVTASEEGATSSVKSATSFEVLVATAATGLLLGWSLAHSLDLELDLVGAVAGCLLALGLLAQEGPIGKSTATVGEFALGAFEVVGAAVKSSHVPAKVMGTVGEELLGVVEITSGAVTKGYLKSLPPVEERLQAEIDKSKKNAEDLTERLDKANAALSEAKSHLARQAENKRVLIAAKSTAAELAEAKKALKHKNVEISESLQQARKERDAFEGDLRAAKAETSRFREMLESRAAMDDDIKALTEASETLEERVRDYETRLEVLTQENDSLRKEYSAEVERMETERVDTRDRISGLETSLARAESRLDEQQVAFRKEEDLRSESMDRAMKAIAASERKTTEMKAAVEKVEAEALAGIKRTAVEVDRLSRKDEKARTSVEVEALKSEVAEAQRAAQEASAAAAEVQGREKQQQQSLQQKERLMTERARKLEDEAKAREEAAAKALREAVAMKEEAEGRLRKREGEEQGQGKEEAKPLVGEDKGAAIVAKKGRARGQQERIRPARAAEAEAASSKPAAPEQRRQREAAPVPTPMLAAAEQAASPATEMPDVAVAVAVAEVPHAEEGGALPKSKSELMKLTVKELRERCKGADVPTTGKKMDLVDRLLESLGSAGAP